MTATSPPHGTCPSLYNKFVVSGSLVYTICGYSMGSSDGFYATSPAVVMTLNVEPGKKECWVAKSPSGGNPSLSFVFTSFHAAFCTDLLNDVNGAGRVE